MPFGRSLKAPVTPKYIARLVAWLKAFPLPFGIN